MESVEQPRIGLSAGPWLRLVSLAGLILIWHVTASALEIRTLPTPWRVLTTFIDHAASGELFFHVAITLARVAAAFFAAMIIGTAIGMVMGRYRGLDNFFDGWLILGLNLPALVITILCYIWFGLTDAAAVLAVTINKVPLVAVTERADLTVTPAGGYVNQAPPTVAVPAAPGRQALLRLTGRSLPVYLTPSRVPTFRSTATTVALGADPTGSGIRSAGRAWSVGMSVPERL